MNIDVARAELARTRVVEEPTLPLGAGQARLRVDAFALSTNNITYAVFGDALRYWEFFPVADGEPGEWGRVPVWGFAEVVETRSGDVEVGERLYGYLPMATELVIDVGRADERGVTDVAPHRAEMAGAYSRYVRCATDPVHRPDREDEQMLLYPLFFTAFVIDDFLADNGDFGAEQVVISSASSKTAIGTAHLAHARGRRVVGLTSPGNAAFVTSLGVYDEVRPYAEAGELAQVPSVYVDIAGNADVTRAVHERLADRLGHSMIVGGTHWDHQAASPAGEPLPGPAPAFFFAPSQIAKRTRDWGSDELDRRLGEAWDAYATWTASWLELRHAEGADAVVDVYQQLLEGHVDPRLGFICAL